VWLFGGVLQIGSDLDECGVCNGQNSDIWCDGECFSGALIDDCGDCSLPDEFNSALDECGVCDGDGMSCATVVDINGYEYPLTLVNGQKWMQENLRVTKYNNGDDVENYSCNDIGKLYQRIPSSEDREICPEGWRLPSKSEYEWVIDNWQEQNLNLEYAGFYDPTPSPGDCNNGFYYWTIEQWAFVNEAYMIDYSEENNPSTDSYYSIRCV
jgi:hypothetical protein